MSRKSIDDKLKKLGFNKVDEGKKHVYYEAKEIWGTHRVDLFYKFNKEKGNGKGKSLIQSYEKTINKQGFNNMCGITAKEAKLFIKKMKKKKW